MPTPLAQLAGLITEHSGHPLPGDVREAARRTLHNVLATTIGASHEQATDIVVAAASEFADGPAMLPGRTERLATRDAAFATGIAAHLDDYDDTHLSTVIHPGAVCLSALVGLQDEFADADDERILTAFAWGVEAQLRLGIAVSPEHYDAGWHITGTCGAVGAAVTGAVLLGLDEDQLRVALEWAVESGLGNREGFGSMTKPFHPGKAAVHGLRAVRDAATGTPGPGDTLTGPDGFVARLSRGAFRPQALLGEPGARWELRDNTFKPYPCGIVSHPAIEAAETLHPSLNSHGGPDAVADIRLVCHPLVPELTGNLNPTDGLQARFSTAHGIAAGLLTPKVDLSGYATDVVVSGAARRLRSLITFDATPECDRDAARLVITLTDGTVLEHEVTHAKGSLARPLTEEELRTKTEGLVERVLPGGAAAIEAATREPGPGYLRGLLHAAHPDSTGASTAVEKSTPELGPEPGDETEEHVLARELAAHTVSSGTGEADVDGEVAGLAAEAARARARVTDTRDPRERAGALAAVLTRAGHAPERAAAAAAAARFDSPDGGVITTALRVAERLATRLEVPANRVDGVAATVAASLATRAPARVILMALGLAATGTTTVIGDEDQGEVTALRARYAAEDGVEDASLAHNGFTGPEHPLTGRRGVLSLLKS